MPPHVGADCEIEKGNDMAKKHARASRSRAAKAPAKAAAKRRSAALPLAIASAGIGAVFFALLTGKARRSAPHDGHAAPDLAADRPHPAAAERAPVAFRPDPTAPVPPEEREALRPATGPRPTLVEGSDVSEGRAPAGG